ncbi:MAG: hypothetical protein RLZZ157_191, partial [Pseudomonadota bacterium]
MLKSAGVKRLLFCGSMLAGFPGLVAAQTVPSLNAPLAQATLLAEPIAPAPVLARVAKGAAEDFHASDFFHYLQQSADFARLIGTSEDYHAANP